MDNLRYIRETMELATAFTGISGWGEIAIGITALIASVIAAQQLTFNAWLAVWIAEGLISLLIAGWSMDRKTPRSICHSALVQEEKQCSA